MTVKDLQNKAYNATDEAIATLTALTAAVEERARNTPVPENRTDVDVSFDLALASEHARIAFVHLKRARMRQLQALNA